MLNLTPLNLFTQLKYYFHDQQFHVRQLHVFFNFDSRSFLCRSFQRSQFCIGDVIEQGYITIFCDCYDAGLSLVFASQTASTVFVLQPHMGNSETIFCLPTLPANDTSSQSFPSPPRQSSCKTQKRFLYQILPQLLDVYDVQIRTSEEHGREGEGEKERVGAIKRCISVMMHTNRVVGLPAAYPRETPRYIRNWIYDFAYKYIQRKGEKIDLMIGFYVANQ